MCDFHWKGLCSAVAESDTALLIGSAGNIGVVQEVNSCGRLQECYLHLLRQLPLRGVGEEEEKKTAYHCSYQLPKQNLLLGCLVKHWHYRRTEANSIRYQCLCQGGGRESSGSRWDRYERTLDMFHWHLCARQPGKGIKKMALLFQRADAPERTRMTSALRLNCQLGRRQRYCFCGWERGLWRASDIAFHTHTAPSHSRKGFPPAPIPSKSLLCKAECWLLGTPIQLHTHLTWEGRRLRVFKWALSQKHVILKSPLPLQLHLSLLLVARTSSNDKLAIPVRNMQSKPGAREQSITWKHFQHCTTETGMAECMHCKSSSSMGRSQDMGHLFNWYAEPQEDFAAGTWSGYSGGKWLPYCEG